MGRYSNSFRCISVHSHSCTRACCLDSSRHCPITCRRCRGQSPLRQLKKETHSEILALCRLSKGCTLLSRPALYTFTGARRTKSAFLIDEYEMSILNIDNHI